MIELWKLYAVKDNRVHLMAIELWAARHPFAWAVGNTDCSHHQCRKIVPHVAGVINNENLSLNQGDSPPDMAAVALPPASTATAGEKLLLRTGEPE